MTKNEATVKELDEIRGGLHSDRDSALIRLIDALKEYFTVKDAPKKSEEKKE